MVDSLTQAIQMKGNKCNPLIGTIRAQGQKVKPLIVITARVRRAIHRKSIKLHVNKLRLVISWVGKHINGENELIWPQRVA